MIINLSMNKEERSPKTSLLLYITIVVVIISPYPLIVLYPLIFVLYPLFYATV